MRKNPTLFGTNAIAAFAVAVIGAAASGGATTAERLAVSPAFNLTGTTYSQNFNNTGADNALATTGTGTTTPAGWGFVESGTNANTIYTANNGGSNTGETYSYGATGSSERAFGALRSGSLVPTFGACFANATGQSITSVQISYAGELWRRGGTNRTDRIDFQYAIGATDLSTGTYVNVDTLDYTSPSGAAITGSGGNSTPLDSQTISGSFTPTGGIAPNQTFCVRWTDFDPSGADDGIGVDDFNMTLTLQPLNQVSLSPTSLPAGVAGSLYNSGTITAVNGSGCTFTSTPADTLSNAGLQLNTTGTNTATVTGTPTQAGPVSFTLNAECTTNGNAQQAYTITVNAAPAIGSCGASKTFIGTAQSSGTSGTVGATVTIEGVVTGFFLSNTGVREGFYVQDADNENDGTTATSDGIFVYDQNNSFAGTLSVGNKVRLRGQVAEFSTLTEIVPNAGELIVCPATANGVTPVDIAFPLSLAEREKFEGMLVRVTSPMTLTGGFNLQTFGEMEISSGGRLFTPTQVAEPGAAANSVLASYDARRVILNDFSRQSNITSIPYYPSFSATNTLRAGVEVNPNWTAVVDYRFGAYQLNPTVVLTLNTATNPRPSAPASVGTGSRVFKVAGSNVLNFFTTLNSRGANTAGELATQRAKIVAALRTLDADVIGLTEIQNNGATLPISDSQAIGNLLNALNATPGDQYTLVPTGGSLGSDLITQAIIYKPSRVTPIGSFASQANAGTGRVNLAQRFRPFDGSRTDLQEFTVVVVHWKSKSSSGASGADADQNDGQGAYNATRVQIANDTVSWLASNPTSDPNPAGSRKVVLVGDFNAYRQEDPIDVMVGAGYKPLLDFFTQGFLYYSYNFDNMSGALDHAIASTAFERVTTGTVEYHINADEPAAIDYNTEDSKPASWTDTTQYRASDHDPVLVGFNPLTGDFDNDGDVDSADAAIMRAAIGKPASSVDRRIDMDGDGVISLNDNRLFTLAARAFTIVGI